MTTATGPQLAPGQLGATFGGLVARLDVARSWLEARPGPEAIAIGALAGVSTFFGFTVVADAGIVTLALIHRNRPPWWALAIAVPIALSALWSSLFLWPLETGARIVALGSIFTRIAVAHRPKLAVGFAAVLGVQAVLILPNLGVERVAGLAATASLLGQAGLVMFILLGAGVFTRYTIVAGRSFAWRGAWWHVAPNWLPVLVGLVTAVTLGASQSRTAWLAALIVAVWWRSKFLGVVLAMTVAVGIFAAWQSGQLLRFSYGGITDGIFERQTLFDQAEDTPGRASFLYLQAAKLAKKEAGLGPLAVAPVPTSGQIEKARALWPLHEPRYSLLGYGYGDFVHETNTQRPHVIPVLAAYDIGVLAIVVAVTAGALIYYRRLSVLFMIVTVVLWMLTEEQWSAGGGHWLLALTAVALPAALKEQKKWPTAKLPAWRKAP